MKVSCLKCGADFERVDAATPCPTCGAPPSQFLAYVDAEAASRTVVREVKPPTTGATEPASTPTLIDLRRVGRYEIQARIGAGGMGVVYRARDAALDRVVALKVMIAGEHASEDTLARFQREARAAAKLTHPNIVTVYDVGSEPGGLHYFAMELVEGRSLDRANVSAKEAARICREVARALEYAHSQGVIHRDIKPANILLDAAGMPRVADFGLAKNSAEEASLTRPSEVMGTACYMPPEQAAGMSQVDAQSDVYALGAVLYELLSGKRPFEGPTVASILRDVEEKEPVPPSRLAPDVPRELETICLMAMAKEKSRRYASAAAMADDLGRFLAGEPVAARRSGTAHRVARFVRRHPAAVGLGALAAGLAVVLAVLLLRPDPKPPPGPDPMALLAKAAPHYRTASASYEKALKFREPEDRKEMRATLLSAVAELDLAVAAWPGFADAYALRGAIRANLNQREEARADLDRALELDPRLADAYYDRVRLRAGDAILRAQKFPVFDAGAVTVTVAAEDRAAAAADVEALRKLGAREDKALTAAAGLIVFFGEAGDPLPLLDKALVVNSTLADARVLRAAWLLRTGGDTAVAEKDLGAAISYEPNHVEAYRLRAALLIRTNRAEEAIRDGEELVSISPDEPQSYVDRAGILISAGMPKGKYQARVDADLGRALELDPENAAALFLRASDRILRTKFGGAQEDPEAISADLEAALASEPGLFPAHLARLLMDLSLGDDDAYREHFEEFRREFPTYPAEKIPELQQGIAMMKIDFDAKRPSGRTYQLLSQAGKARARGDLAEVERLAREILSRLDDPAEAGVKEAVRAMYRGQANYALACALAAQGKKEEAFRALEAALQTRAGTAKFQAEKDLQSLHADPRWGKLVAKYGKRHR